VIREEIGLRIDRQVAIAGRVTKAGGAEPVTGAVVLLTKMPREWRQRVITASGLSLRGPGSVTSGPNGLYFFLDLPDGEYAAAAGSGQEQPAVVRRNDAGRLQMVWVDLTADSTTVGPVTTGLKGPPQSGSVTNS
jgi:hypothetical protein